MTEDDFHLTPSFLAPQPSFTIKAHYHFIPIKRLGSPPYAASSHPQLLIVTVTIASSSSSSSNSLHILMRHAIQ